MLGKALYIVQTDRWYTERAVWGIAGGTLLISTALATFAHPLAVLLVAAVGTFSILDALTGFCVVSTLLLQLGIPSRLTGPGPTPRWLGRPVYRMQTDRWFLERAIYVVVGVNLILATVLVLAHSVWWLLFPAFVGAASLAFAKTGFCPVANVLYQLGFEPRLGRDLPVREAMTAPIASLPS